MLADYFVMLGDTNFRFNTSFSEFIEYVDDAPKWINRYDELKEVKTMCHRFPFYHEEPI